MPNSTFVAPLSPVPLTVTSVPPPGDPLDGETAETVGTGYVYLYRSALVDGVVPLAVVTETLTVPAACAGAMAVADVDEEAVNDAVDGPN